MKYSDRPNAYINAKDLEIAVVKATTYGDALSAVRKVPAVETKQIKYFDEDEKVWKIGNVIVE